MSSQMLPPLEGPEYRPCACSHIESEYDINGRWCAMDDCPCNLYRPDTATSAMVSPPPSRAALRDRIRRAICEAEGFAWDTDMLEPDEYGDVADAVLAVLPVQDDRAVIRAAALLEGATAIDLDRDVTKPGGGKGAYRRAMNRAADLMRRLAVKAQDTATAEHHTVDGARYLCHTDDHYCPSEARPAGTQQPRRGDQVEAWLRARRDEHRDTGHGVWSTLDALLDQYRLLADTGTPLGEHVCEGRVVGDCECLEPAPECVADCPHGCRAAADALTRLGQEMTEGQPAADDEEARR
ncbi:hypothetical protein E2C11_16420 [Streptomyces lavendulae]|nr:hypothetical protein [Streptomyces lavendulae]TXJ78591.1 hypothetical protein E2C11_16420 [Streptomyces lavendulae]